MSVLFEIITPNFDTYKIHQNGDIERTDMKHTPSGQWKFLGIQHVRKNVFIPLSKLSKGTFPSEMLYKNGKPQFTVRDRDHGTIRTWGNTEYHGIKYVRFPQ